MNKNKRPWQTPVTVNGTWYPSLNAAGRAFNVTGRAIQSYLNGCGGALMRKIIDEGGRPTPLIRGPYVWAPREFFRQTN